MMKTNKSYSKRLKTTKDGRVLARKSGRNHFNAKENQAIKSTKKNQVEFKMSNKDKSLFLVNIKAGN